MTYPARRERKMITVVFADLVGFTARSETMDPEDVEAFLRPYHEQLRAGFERFGGVVEKFIGDAVVAVFGAPITHEDDGERAVRAALGVRDLIREAGELEVRIAVDTGEAIVRLDADPSSGDPIATGDVLTVASRLQSAAPVNGILVGEATHRATRDVIVYGRPISVEAKGKSQPIRAWEALEARSRLGIDVQRTERVPLVGRERERTILVETLARAESQREPQLVTLVGVPGIGKSRLVYELFREVEADPDFRYWRQGRSLPYGEGVSFWALGEMVKAHAGILEGDPPNVIEDKLAIAVRELVPSDQAEWVIGWLRPLVGLRSMELMGSERRDESFTAWRGFFEGLAEQHPLILVFEDLHWADDSLLDFIDHLADWARGVPILILCTTRPELLERRPGWGGGKADAVTLRISPLSDAESRTFLSLVLETADITDQTERALLERASGNPLYAEQFARLFLEGGTLDGTRLPDSIQGLIAARLDALALEEKALIQDAAVMGKVFWSGSLGERSQREELLHGLERKEFIRHERRSSVVAQDEFAFRHLLVRDVAYGQIPRAERAAKHLRAAAWIDSLGRPEDHAELLARHYGLAIESSATPLDGETLARARAAIQQAAEHALSLNAYGPASNYYRSALALTDEGDPLRGHLLLGLGRSVYAVDATGEEVLEDAVATLVASGDVGTAAEAETILVVIYWTRGEGDRWRAHLDRAMDLVADLPPSRSKAVVLAARARRLYVAGESQESLDVAGVALGMATALSLDDVRANLLNTIGMARWTEGESDGSELRESIRISEALNSAEVFLGYNNLSSVLLLAGDVRGAEEASIEGHRVAMRFGSAEYLRWSEFFKIDWAFHRGDWDEVEAEAEGLIASLGAGEASYQESPVRAIRAIIQLGRDDFAGSLEDARSGMEAARRAGDPQLTLPAASTFAWILLETGQREAAETHVTALLKEDARSITLPSTIWTVGELGYADAWRERHASARPTLWIDAARAALAGDWVAASGIYERIGSGFSEAIARQHAVTQLLAAGRRTEAKDQAAKALTFWRRAGATRFIAQIEAELSG